MHRPRFVYAYKLKRLSVGPETRNPNKHYCTLSGRNQIRSIHVFKMHADAILFANGRTMETRIALTIRLSETAVQHWREKAYRLRACSTREVDIHLRGMPFKATRAGRMRKQQMNERNCRRERCNAQSTFFATALAACLEFL